MSNELKCPICKKIIVMCPCSRKDLVIKIYDDQLSISEYRRKLNDEVAVSNERKDEIKKLKARNKLLSGGSRIQTRKIIDLNKEIGELKDKINKGIKCCNYYIGNTPINEVYSFQEIRKDLGDNILE